MDNLPDSGVQRPVGGFSRAALLRCAAARNECIKAELLERLRVCAALDRRFFKAWFDELDMERCCNFSSVVGVSSNMYIDTEWNMGVYAHSNTPQESEAAFHRIAFELQDLEDREKRLTDYAQTLNRQYEGLMAKLTEPAYNGTVRTSSIPVPPNSRMQSGRAIDGLSRIATVISAKEEEQKSHLYHLRHWNVNISGVNIPRLPGLLYKRANEDS